jgi:hypothetical protein
MSTVQRIELADEVVELVEATRGTNAAFDLLTAASGDGEIPIEQAVEVCKRIADRNPRE